MENLIILGSGPAGLTAAIYAARANLKPLVVAGEQPGGQLITTTEVENFPGFPEGIGGQELVDKMREQAEKFGARFLSGSVTKSDLKSQPLKLTMDDGAVLETRSLIVATGAAATYLGLPSERQLMNKGVSACATCDGFFYRGLKVAVVGGGDTAMEEATFLTRYADKVYLIHRRDAFRASKIMADRALANPKISVLWNTVVKEVLDVQEGKVTGLRLQDVKTQAETELAVDGLFLAIGHKPNTAPFVGQLDMDAVGYLKAEDARTAVPGVFAAGDVQDPHYRQAVTAAGSGCMAALAATSYLEAQGL